MALFLKNTTIYHPGRTAGHWVRKTLAEQQLIVGTTPFLHDQPQQICYTPLVQERAHSLSFVRHPARWLRSLWIHETQYGWTMEALRPTNRFGTFQEYLEDIIERYPNGAATAYFSNFIDAVSVNLASESLGQTLWPTLSLFGEAAKPEATSTKPVNCSPTDFVTKSAGATRQTWDQYLRTEREFCARFGYHDAPTELVLPQAESSRLWFPQFREPDAKDSTTEVQPPNPHEIKRGPAGLTDPLSDHLFLFDSITNRRWDGDPGFWRSQVAFIEALQQRSGEPHKKGCGTFLELGSGDGYFVFLSEQLGYENPTGIDHTSRSTIEVAKARIGSKATFIQGPPLLVPAKQTYDTVLVRHLVNEYPWPHLVLRQAAQWLTADGLLIISAIVLSIDTKEPFTLSIDPDTYGLPPTCTKVPTEAAFLDVLRESGFSVAKRYAEYDQFVYENHPLCKFSNEVHPLTPWSLQTIVLGLKRTPATEHDPREGFWFRHIPNMQMDLAPSDTGEIAVRTIRQLAQENADLRAQVAHMASAIRDRETTISHERADFERELHELQDRTSRLENANQALCQIEALIDQWRTREPKVFADLNGGGGI